MWYINLKAYNSNHSRYCNSIFIRTIIFHNIVTTMLGLAKFLTIWERRRFKSISTSWKFIPNTNPGLPAMIALGHLWYNLGTHFAGSISAAQSRILPIAKTIRTTLPFGSRLAPRTYLLPPVCALLQNEARPDLSYLASWLKRVIRPAK